MKYLCTLFLLLSMYGHADYYDVQIPSGEGFVVVVGSNVIKDPAGRVFTYSRAVNEATKQKQACQSKCEVYVRMYDLRVDGKLIKSSSSSSSSPSSAGSSAASSSSPAAKISFLNATQCEGGQSLAYDNIVRYEAMVISDGVTKYIQIQKTPDPVTADIGEIKQTDSVRAATVAIECGGTKELYSRWVSLQ